MESTAGRSREAARRARCLTPPGSGGFVTAELAVALPVLVLVWAVLLFGIVAVAAQVRCIDAARELARAAARGESATTMSGLAGQLGPQGATWSTHREGRFVVARVAVTLRMPQDLLGFDLVSASAIALVEPQEPTWADAPGL